MARTLTLSRLALLAPAVAFLLAGCGGYDTIVDSDDATSTADGHDVTPDGSGGGGAAPDGSRGDVSTSPDVQSVDVNGDGRDAADLDVSVGLDGHTEADAALTVEAGTDADASLIVVDAGISVDAPSTADARIDAEASLIPDAGTSVDASVTVDANLDASAAVDASIEAEAGMDAGARPDADASASLDSGVFSILGSAETFAVFAGQTISNTGLTVIQGNMGLSPLTALGGTPPTVLGAIHLNDLVAQQAQGDLTTAYNLLAGKVCEVALTGQDLGGLTLAPGVYCFTSSAQLTGNLVLDAQGDPNSVWIFQIASTLVTANNSNITAIGGGNPCNVYWQVGSSATIGTSSVFSGNIIALASTSVQAGAAVAGRILSRAAGAVTLESNTVSIATCPGGPTVDAGLDLDASTPDGDVNAPEVDAGTSDAGVDAGD